MNKYYLAISTVAHCVDYPKVVHVQVVLNCTPFEAHVIVAILINHGYLERSSSERCHLTITDRGASVLTGYWRRHVQREIDYDAFRESHVKALGSVERSGTSPNASALT